MTRRAYVASAIVGGLVVAGAASVSPAQAEKPSSPGCAVPALDRPQKAQDVARTNPGAFRSAEVRNAGSVPGLATRAMKDGSIWLDRCADAYYVEETATAVQRTAAGATMGEEPASSTAAPLASVPLAETFTLESKPGSARTIYLDFTGETVTGTAWNASYGSTLTFDPFSIDTAVSTAFSAAELTEMQKVWQVVAEDYAPFDVNVTLKDPGVAAIDRTSSSDLVYGTRAVITNGGSIYNACGCGGMAYINVFNSTGTSHGYYQPALVFSDGTTKNGKYVGEATAHEVGHNFGLNHDGTPTAGYYSGSSPWAPVMGSSYNQPVSQWSKGEYPDANNVQDDLSQIAAGAAVRGDEDSAGPVSLTGGAGVSGVVSRSTDVDSYSFTAAGATTLSVGNGTPFPNLDVELRVLDSTGAQVALVNPTTTRVSATQAAGMSASHSFVAPSLGARYTAQVRGAGQGALGTAGAYSAYGSLGTYQVSLATQTPSSGTPLAVSWSAMPGGTVAAAYAASPVEATGGVAPYTYTASGLPAGLTINASTGAVSGSPTAAGAFSPVVTVTDATGASRSSSGSLIVAPQPTQAVVVPAQSFVRSVGVAGSNQAVATGGQGSYAWSSGGTLPPGLSFSSGGVLSGTPTTAGIYSFSATVTSGDASGTGTITVTVAGSPLAFVTASLPSAKLRNPYSAAISVKGGTAPYTWARTSGSLPSGLSLSFSGATATVSGTPTKTARTSFTLRATDARGAVVTRTFSVSVVR